MKVTPDPRDAFISQISALYPLEEAAQTYLYDHLRILERARKEIILPVGTVNDSMYFVHTGLAWAYTLKEGKNYLPEKKTNFFAPESNFAFSPPSFFNQKPSQEGISMLEDSVLVALPYQELQEIYQRYPATNAIGRKITERYLLYFYELVEALKLPTGERKYRWFLDRHPNLGARVSNLELASFLGLTQESISRFRGRKHKTT